MQQLPRLDRPTWATRTVFGLALAHVYSGGALASVPALRPMSEIRPIPATVIEIAGEAPYARGKRLLASGDVLGGLTTFRQALAADPSSADLLNGVGVCYDRLGRPDLAKAYYGAALDIEPGAARLHNNLGYSLLLSGQRAEAIAELQIAADGSDEAVARVAKSSLRGINQDVPTVEPSVARNVRPPAEPVLATVERTSEGEQRLDIGVKGATVPSGLGEDVALIAVAQPWRGSDDETLIAEEALDRLSHEPSRRLAPSTVLARKDSGQSIVEASISLLEQDVSSRRERDPFLSDSKESADLKTTGVGAVGGLLLVSNPIASMAPDGGLISSLGWRDRRRLIDIRDPEQPGSDQPFDSDDAQLNAFASRMRAAHWSRVA